MGTVLDLGTRVGPASRELGHPVITAGWESFSCPRNILGFGTFFCSWAQPRLAEN